MDGLIKGVKKRLAKLYKGLSKTKDGLNKDGTSRENSLRERLKKKIHKEETDLSHMQEEKKNLPERVDVTSLEDYSSFKCIDNEGKNNNSGWVGHCIHVTGTKYNNN